jgi:hypothetical protein
MVGSGVGVNGHAFSYGKDGSAATLIRLVDDFASFHNDRGPMFF